MLATLVVVDRGRIEIDIQNIAAGDNIINWHLPFCSNFPACMRVGGWLAVSAIDKTLQSLSLLYLNGEAARLLFVDANFGEPSWQWDLLNPERQFGILTPVAAMVLFRALCLGSILAVALRFFSSSTQQAAFLLIVFGVLLGWPLPAIDAFFAVMSELISWPRHYFIFVYFALPYDFASLGFVFLLALILAQPAQPGLLTTAFLAGLGQTLFENLGLVAGVAIFVSALLVRDTPLASRLPMALRKLIVAGAASLLVGGVLVYGVLTAWPPPATQACGGALSEIACYVQRHWEAFGSNNLAWWKVLLADTISILVFPMGLGAMLGAASCAAASRPAAVHADDYRQFAAALATAAGFTCSLVPGFVVSGLTSDIGRQITPLACLTVIIAAAGMRLLIAGPVSRLGGRPR